MFSAEPVEALRSLGLITAGLFQGSTAVMEQVTANPSVQQCLAPGGVVTLRGAVVFTVVRPA